LLPVSGIVIDATGRAATLARRKGTNIAFRDRMFAELVHNTLPFCISSEEDDAPSWLDYQSSAYGWSYSIRGPRGAAQTWRVHRAGIRPDNTLHRVDASACILSQAAGNGWIAIGDAATSFDPISSQGLFNALSSALAAAGLLLSEEGLNSESAGAWSNAVRATFLRSEATRASSLFWFGT
jgi:hypothetical protein